jgi:acetyl coenzyme A synthetase (ADP forming)-like protein
MTSSDRRTSSVLDAFFAPKSVAVVGASTRETSVGHAILRNLLDGYNGDVYPVNPKGGEILGRKAYESLSAIGASIDLIVVAIPPKFIPSLMEQAAGVGCKAAIIISAGFAEMGESGLALQRDMLDAAKAHGIRLIGPNCLGVIRPGLKLNASFGQSAPPAGKIGLLSQSGALITGIISYAQGEQFGLSAAVSLGAKADVADGEIILWLGSDDETTAIALYVESFPEPRAVYDTLREVAKRKPVVAIKGGATEAGARAASSHTGSLAGSSAAYAAAFSQAGVLQASSIGEFMAWSRALAYQKPAKGNRLAIVTNAGGPGVLSADEASRHGIELAQLSAKTKAKLDEVLPVVWSHNNPIDVIGDATAERYRDALNIIGAAPEVDGVVVIMTVQAMTKPGDVANAIIKAYRDPSWDKPLCSSFLGLVGTEVGSRLDAAGVPEFNTPEFAVSAMGALMKRGAWLAREKPKVRPYPALPQPDHARARQLRAKAREAGQSNLDLALAREVLICAGVRYNGSGTAVDADEATAVAEKIGYPVVIKLISPDVVHKSDVGGVVLDVVGADGVREACTSIRERVESHQPGARITGFTVEEQVSGTEIIVGMSRDPGFGPLIMVGMGGVFVEVYKDVSFRLVPMDERDALDMMGEIKAQPLLDGARGRPVLDRGELAEVLRRVSNFVEALPEIKELDLNPLVITPDGLVAIDARVII